MATYILLLRLTPGGRRRVLAAPRSLLRAERETGAPEVQSLGCTG